MKIFMKVDLNIWHDFCIGHFDQSQPYSKENWKIDMDLNLERICMNLFQTWFKLAITTMIKLRLHELIAGCYTPPPLKEILSRDYKHIGGPAKEVHTHHYRGRNFEYLEWRKSLISHVASCSE
jgi:hypothetical protein